MSYLVLDVSRFNAISDYAAAAKCVDGVLIRAGYRGYGSSGTLTTDSLFTTHWNGFKDKGIKMGVYWFPQAISTAEAEEEADYLYSLIKDLDIDFPIYADSENANSGSGRADTLSANDRTSYIVTFLEKMKSYGYRAGVYASDSWYQNNLVLDTLYDKGYSIWVASYSSAPSRVTTYDAWQYTSSGTIDGYSGSVDLSYFYTDVAGWEGGIDIGTCTGTLSSTEVTYYGYENKPGPTITNGSTTLVMDTDYTVSYEDNINAGTGKCICTGKGNYSGTLTLTFTINPLNISNTTISWGSPDSDGCYSLENLTIKFNGTNLKHNTEYTYSASYHTYGNYNMCDVTFTGVGNFCDSVVTTAPISLLDIQVVNLEDCDASLSSTTFTYNGLAISPAVIITYEGNLLTEGTDYIVTYDDNINAGTATVLITGNGNYEGTITLTFTIEPYSLSNCYGEMDLSIYTYTGNECTPSIIIRDANDNIVIADYYDIEYSDNINAGTATITVTGKGNYTGTLTGQFTIEPASITKFTMELSGTDFPYTGEEIKPEVKIYNSDITLEEDKDYSLEYKNNKDVGTGSVTASGINNYTDTLTEEFIIGAIDISNYTIELSGTSFDYTGEEIKPDVTVYDTEGNVLDPNYYTILYTDNINAGTATVTVYGAAEYAGSISTTFTIIGMDLSDYEAYFEEEVYTYSGDPLEPVPIVIDNEGNHLTADDFYVDYFDNVDVGIAKGTIHGKGNYTGTIEIEFEIEPLDIINLDVVLEFDEAEYTGEEILPRVTLVPMPEPEPDEEEPGPEEEPDDDDDSGDGDGGGNDEPDDTEPTSVKPYADDDTDDGNDDSGDDTGSSGNTDDDGGDSGSDDDDGDDGDDDNPDEEPGPEDEPDPDWDPDEPGTIIEYDNYDAEYRNNIEVGNATIRITGKNNYTGTNSTTFQIIPIDISNYTIELSGYQFPYTGEEIKPEVTIYNLDGEILDPENYDVEYSDNIEIGTAFVNAEAKGNYGGTLSAEFEIIGIDISDYTVTTAQSEYQYTGEEIKPDVTVYDTEGNVLDPENYNIEYSNNTETGTATITVTGIGDYSGTAIGHFEIVGNDISDYTVVLDYYTVEYDGEEKMPGVTVYDTDGNVFNWEYYLVTYTDNTNAGTATVTIRGTQEYSGSIVVTFTITPIDITDTYTINLDSDTYGYTGNEIKPSVTIKDQNGNIIDSDNYTVEYSNNINVGTANITVTGKGNYTGTLSTTFEISSLVLTFADINPDSEIYTGDPIDITITVYDNNGTVVDPSEYTIEMQETIIDPGTYPITITANSDSNYSGSLSYSFVVYRRNIDTGSIICDYEVSNGELIINGYIVMVNDKTLTENTDYDEVTLNVVDEGDYYVINIIVEGINNYMGSLSTTISAPKESKIISLEDCTVTLDPSSYTYTGSEIIPNVIVTDPDGYVVDPSNYELYGDNNINVGTATVTIMAVAGSENYTGYTSIAFMIFPKDIEGCAVSANCTPDGELVGIVVTMDDIQLVGNTDYTYTYSITEDDDYYFVEVEVFGMGNYTGESFHHIEIEKAGITYDLTYATISLSQTTYTYSGNEYTPAVRVLYGSTVLTLNVDYTVQYADNINAGTATVTVTGMDKYEGTRVLTFTIDRLNLSDCIITSGAADENGCYNLGNLEVELNNLYLERNVDYTASFEYEREDYNDYSIYTTIDITGINNYVGSASKEFKTGVISLDINNTDIHLEQTDIYYTGDIINPEVVSDELVEGKDYTVEYIESVNYGTYTVTVTGIGNYTGTMYLEYHIIQLDISRAIITCGEPDEEGLYDINNLEVTLDGNILKSGTDYQYVVYEENSESGTYVVSTVVITGINNYTGTVSAQFNTGENQIYPGRMVTLDLAPIYARYCGTVSHITKTGVFYLWDDQIVNDRIRITDNTSGVGKLGFICGWVGIEYVFTSAEIEVGDEVIVTGEINSYADGSGYSISKNKALMYIVDIMSDQTTYPYAYAVATKVNREKQGWAKLDMLKKNRSRLQVLEDLKD